MRIYARVKGVVTELTDFTLLHEGASFIYEDVRYTVEFESDVSDISCNTIMFDVDTVDRLSDSTETGYTYYQITMDCICCRFSYSFSSRDIERVQEVIIKFTLSNGDCNFSSSIGVSNFRVDSRDEIKTSYSRYLFESAVHRFMCAWAVPIQYLLDCFEFKLARHVVVGSNISVILDELGLDYNYYIISDVINENLWDVLSIRNIISRIECYVHKDDEYVYLLCTTGARMFKFILRDWKVLYTNYTIKGQAALTKRLL